MHEVGRALRHRVQPLLEETRELELAVSSSNFKRTQLSVQALLDGLDVKGMRRGREPVHVVVRRVSSR
jgi:hypothetical protein